MYCARDEHGIHVHLSFGRVIDRLAASYQRTLLCLPVFEGPPDESRDYRLGAPNIELIPQPAYRTSLEALRFPVGIVRAYAELCRRADDIFVRAFIPYVAQFYALARRRRRRPCHWIVGNPRALLRSHRRAGRLMDTASWLYSWQNEHWTRLGRWLTDGALLCNGAELGALFRSPRTIAAVSSTVTLDEFYERPDTCQGPTVELLFIGIPRPEKGLQYLVQALPLLRMPRPWRLTVVGASEQFRKYRAEVERHAEQLGLAERIRWVGYVPYGPEMFAYLRAADVFILPTLSEGTPRVLIEARANSVPVVASNVGGIPTSVRDGHDGLLVPPKDPAAIAAAIDRIVADGELRRALIRNGHATAQRWTVDAFAAVALAALSPG